MAYYNCIGFGGGSGSTTPQVVQYEHKPIQTSQTTWTSSASFSLQPGDRLIIAVRHQREITIPTGFSLVDSSSVGSYTFSILMKEASAAETITPAVSQASSGSIAGIMVQIRDASVFTLNDSGSGTATTATVGLSSGAFIFFLANGSNYAQELSGNPMLFFEANKTSTCNVSMGLNANCISPASQVVTVAYGYSSAFAYFSYSLE